MKKLVLLFVCFFTINLLHSQSVPNGSMDNWENVSYNGNNASDYRPVSWDASNIHTLYLGFIQVDIVTVSRNSSPYSGSYCAQLESKQTMTGFPVSPGFITTGNFWYTISPQAGGIDGGMPFQFKPDSLVFYCKTQPSSGDKCIAHLNIRADASGNHSMMGTAYTAITGTLSQWTRISLPVTYTSTAPADSMILTFCSSDFLNQGNVASGSKMWVDDVAFKYNPNLSSITPSAGSLQPAFSPGTTYYIVTLPPGTSLTPSLTVITESANSTYQITDAADITSSNISDRISTVTVTGNDGLTTKIYQVEFMVTQSDDATLASLFTSTGSLNPPFHPLTENYSVTLPYGTVATPQTTAITANAAANAIVTDAVNVNSALTNERTTTIHVTAENGTTTKDYSIIFNVSQFNNDASLSDLTVNGTTVSGFHPDTLAYNVTLPHSTMTLPVIGATPNDTAAGDSIIQATSLPGTGSVIVTAADGSTTRTYFVNFFRQAPAHDATLSDLRVNDTTISGFNPAVFVYEYYVPSGTVSIPAVTAMAHDPNAYLIINQAASIPGQAEINVFAEDSTTVNTYLINIHYVNGIDAPFHQPVKLYPNPASDKVIIETSKQSVGISFEVFNLHGNRIMKKELSGNIIIIDISDIPAGSYFYHLKDNEIVLRGSFQVIK